MNCNNHSADEYNTAIVKMPDGEVKEIELIIWTDYENSDAISIYGKNGEKIYTHLNNVVLIRKKQRRIW